MFQFNIIRDEYPTDRTVKDHSRNAVRAVIFCKNEERGGYKLLMVKTSVGDYKFPGGGMEHYEDDKTALLREIREETGYLDVTVGPCIGKAYEQNLDNFRDNCMFSMHSSYYLCYLNSYEKTEQKLVKYEKDMDFRPVFVDVATAHKANEELLIKLGNKKLDLIEMRANDWLERETIALRYLETSVVDKLLCDIFLCGQIMKNADRSHVKVDGKEGHANFVTNYDKMIQDELKSRLLDIYPEAVFIGEEGEGFKPISEGMALIVDPIDGTTNFMKDYKTSCISVGITKDGTQIGGIVYQPFSEEMYCAELGKGAFLNGNKIHVSDCDLEHALVSFGTAPYYEELKEKSFATAKKMLDYCIDVRRSGSAAIDLCHVAVGRVDLYFEYRVCPWDIAAGSLIVTEAGGCISTTEGGDITLENKCSILATNGVVKLIQ